MKITKGCPMCGEKEKVKLMCLNTETNEAIGWDEAEGNVYTWFHCYECDAEFLCDMPVHTPENMIEWWNTRKPMERIVERLEEESYDSMHIDMSRPITETWQIIDLDKAIEIVKEEM